MSIVVGIDDGRDGVEEGQRVLSGLGRDGLAKRDPRSAGLWP